MSSIKAPRVPAVAAALCAAAIGLAVAIGAVSSGHRGDPAHAGAAAGPRLAAQFDLPREQLDRFGAFVPRRPLPDEPRQAPATCDWISEPISLDASMDRRAITTTVSVTIDGQAVADGAVSVALNAGWRTQDGERLLLNLPEAREPVAEARQPVRLVLTSPPLQLPAASTDLMLALVGAQNLRFDRVRVQVWAGPPRSTHGPTAAVAALLLGAGVLALWAWPRRGAD